MRKQRERGNTRRDVQLTSINHVAKWFKHVLKTLPAKTPRKISDVNTKFSVATIRVVAVVLIAAALFVLIRSGAHVAT